MGLLSYLRESSIETFLGVAIGAAALGIVGYNHETARSERIPLAFSEKTQIEKDLEAQGKEAGRITRFLTSTNDACMKIFEAYNKSRKEKNKENGFAEALRVASDDGLSPYHYTLSDLLDDLPQEADLVLSELMIVREIADKVEPANKNFDDAWTESHTDNYHYSPRIVTTTDSKGHIHTHTEMKRVYDDTTHRYWYHPEPGEAASQGLQMLVSLHSSIRVEEVVPSASKTNPDGEIAANSSMEHPKEKPVFDNNELLEIASKWNAGSTINRRLPEIYNMWDLLGEDLQKWLVAKQTARDTSYKTNWHSDSGPTEYRIANDSLSHGRKFVADVGDVVSGVDFVREKSPELHEK